MDKELEDRHSTASGQAVRTILVVEDDEALLTLIQKSLRRAGFQAEGVVSGSGAMERIASNPPALLLLDYHLSDVTGDQVVGALDTRNCSVPFIVITGQGDERVAVKMMKLGARDYLVKDSSFLDRLSRVVGLVMGQLATERELAEAGKVLKESESRYRAVFENTGTAMLIIEEGMTISMANREFVKLCGYSRKEVEGNKSWTEFVVGEDLERMKEYHKSRRVGARSAPGSYEFRFADREGNIKDVFLTVTMIPGTNKSMASLLDITERKQVERALLESEAKFRTFMETASDLMHITDKDQNITYVNESMAGTMGYSRKEMIGMHFTQLLSEQYLKGFEQRTEKLIRQGKLTHEPVWVTKEGREVYLEMKVVAVYDDDGKYAGSRGVSRDVTERKRAEKELHESEERYRTLAEAMNDGVFTLDIEGKYSYVNRRFEEITGYPSEDLVGQHFRKVIAPEYLELAIDTFRRGISGEETPLYEIENLHKDGKRIPIELNVKAMLDKEGRVTGRLGVARDITERKRAEQALWDSEEKFRAFMETASDLMHITDKEGNLTYVNESMARTLGYSREEMIGMHITQLLSEHSLEGFKLRTEKLISHGKITYEPVWVTKEGREVYLETKVVAVYDGDGNHAGSRGISRDITERKRVAEELRLRAQLLDTAIDSIFLNDFNGNMIYVNETFCRFHGYSREEMMGMSLRQLGTPQYDRLMGQRLRQVEEEGSGIFETAHLHKDGSVLPMEVHSRVIESGGRKLVLTVGRDITERKKMEEELELRATLLDNVQDTVNLSDFDGNIIYVNEMACKSLGYSREELLKMNLAEMDTAEYAHSLKWRNQELTKKKHTIFETANFRKDRSVIPVEVHSRLIEVGGKKLALSIDRDITERKQMEVERKEMELKAQLASRLASVGEMASGIAHEINNPLVGVIGFAQLLMERKDLPEDAREELKIISDGGQRVSNIVKGMLSFARQQKPERTYVDINQIIETTLKLRTYEMATASINVVTQLDPELPWTMADAGQLQQVFLNLAINAEKEMILAHGRGKLMVKTAVIDRTIRISFKDDGSGIGKKNLDRIFDPFFTTREVGQGTGLGLSICHGIIAEHNGRIYAESKPGKGATFIVELPVISEEKQLEMAEPAAGETQQVAKARILVVDDEPTNLQYLKELLTQEGHEVETADNAGDALKMIEGGGYDLILLDVKMPGMSGMELYKRIQKTVPSLDGRVVFITGDVKGTDTVEFLFRAEVPYVTKPFDSKKLKKIINHILTG